jgi:hypothetical protein
MYRMVVCCADVRERASEHVRVTRETARERDRAKERWGVAASKLRLV